MDERERVDRKRAIIAWAMVYGVLGCLAILHRTGLELFLMLAAHATVGILVLNWAARRLEVELSPRDPRRRE